MSWKVSSRWQPMDANAAAYITAVETADGQALEEKTKIAIDNFVLGCKQDGIWSAIKASCILAGARTLSGALVPLVGAAPTNFNFVSGDYNRKTGLVGNGSTKYLDSNITHAQASSSATNRHSSVYWSAAGNNSALLSSGNSASSDDISVENAIPGVIVRSTSTTSLVSSVRAFAPSFIGHTRNSSASFVARGSGASYTFSVNAGTLTNSNYTLFALPSNIYFSTCRLAFYSIGESLDLALLDARVTELINAFAAAIP